MISNFYNIIPLGAIIIGLLTVYLVLSSNGMVISSPMDDIEQCIYTCNHCFQVNSSSDSYILKIN